MDKIAIVLVDDHPILRRGLRSLLESNPNFKKAGETDDGIAALALVDRLRPNILITGLQLSGIAGLEVAKQVIEHYPPTRVMIFTTYRSAGFVKSALKIGVSGYVVKDTDLTDVVEAVTVIAAGGRFISDIAASKPIPMTDFVLEPMDNDCYNSLTSREREVLLLTVEGDSYAQVAEALFISPRTVETHRANAMKKLGLRSRADLIRFAIRKGILSTSQN